MCTDIKLNQISRFLSEASKLKLRLDCRWVSLSEFLLVTGHYVPNSYEDHKGSVESVRLEIEGSLVKDSAEAQCCVLEQDILSSP